MVIVSLLCCTVSRRIWPCQVVYWLSDSYHGVTNAVAYCLTGGNIFRKKFFAVQKDFYLPL